MTLIERVNALASTMGGYIKNSILPRLLPSGGADGQVLSKTSGTNYTVGWTDKGSNFKFERLAALPQSGNFEGRIVHNLLDNNLYEFRGVSFFRFIPTVSDLNFDELAAVTDYSVAANQVMIKQAFDEVVALGTATDMIAAYRILELNNTMASPLVVQANIVQGYNFGIGMLMPYKINNLGSPRAIKVTNPYNAIENTTPLLYTGDVIVPTILNDGSWAYTVIPAPVVDTDYVAIFNTAIA